MNKQKFKIGDVCEHRIPYYNDKELVILYSDDEYGNLGKKIDFLYGYDFVNQKIIDTRNIDDKIEYELKDRIKEYSYAVLEIDYIDMTVTCTSWCHERDLKKIYELSEKDVYQLCKKHNISTKRLKDIKKYKKNHKL